MLASLNNSPIQSATIYIPYYGIWHADVYLATDDVPSGRVSLILGGLNMSGSVYRQGSWVGTTKLRIVGGSGGWNKILPSKAYQSDAGVSYKLVTGDLAHETGEIVSLPTDFVMGTFFTRETAPAARTLNANSPAWYVDFTGTTILADRSTGVVTSRFDVVETTLEQGKVLVATDFPEDWIPNKTFSSATLSKQTISAVVHKLDKSKLRTEVWCL